MNCRQTYKYSVKIREEKTLQNDSRKDFRRLYEITRVNKYFKIEFVSIVNFDYYQNAFPVKMNLY